MRVLLWQNSLSMYFGSLRTALVGSFNAVFDLLLTRAFCFQPCGLRLIVMLIINHSRESCDSSFFALLFFSYEDQGIQENCDFIINSNKPGWVL